MSEITFIRMASTQPKCVARTDPEIEQVIFHLVSGLEFRRMPFAYIFPEGQTLGRRVDPKTGRGLDCERLPDLPSEYCSLLFWLASEGFTGIGEQFFVHLADGLSSQYNIIVCAIGGNDCCWNIAEQSGTIILSKVKLVL
jgi:hypothetical protein